MNIYISNINYRTKRESLEQLFANYGTVDSATIVMDRETGRSRGFGFVEMSDDAEGRTAIEATNGLEFEGKVLNVSVARPREERGPRAPRSNGYRDDRRDNGFRSEYRSNRPRY